MPRRTVKELRDLIIDEVSLVDKGANQHARTVIAKNYGEEEQEMEIYDEAGNPVDPASLEDGDIVFDADGQAYQFSAEDDPEEVEEVEEERVPELVGKRNPFLGEPVRHSRGLAETVREELSKALTDADRDAIISKALGQIDEYAEIAKSAQFAAEQERQLRLEREYTEIAKNYNVPVDPETLGGVLMRCAESLSYEDCEVIAKCLDAAGEALFQERGFVGGGANTDVFAEVEAAISSMVSKSGGSHEEALAEYFAQNPEAYDQYLAGN